MHNKDNLKLREIIDQEFQAQFEEERDLSRVKTKEQILKVQSKNCKAYNRRKALTKYKIGDLVVIKQTQFGPGRKLWAKYLGPYVIEKVKPNNTYNVRKIGNHEGRMYILLLAPNTLNHGISINLNK